MYHNLFIVGASEHLALGDMVFLLLAMIVLLILIKKYTWKPINKILDERSNKISNDLNDAEKAKNESQELAQKRKNELNEAENDAKNIIKEAENNAKNQSDIIIKDANKNVKQMKINAEKQIDQNRLEVMESVKKDVAELTLLVANKVLKKELKENDQRTLIDSYIDELGEK